MQQGTRREGRAEMCPRRALTLSARLRPHHVEDCGVMVLTLGSLVQFRAAKVSWEPDLNVQCSVSALLGRVQESCHSGAHSLERTPAVSWFCFAS